MKKITIPLMISALLALAGCTSDDGKTTQLVFNSFDGGGLEYTIVLDDPEIISYTVRKEYRKANHAELGGAGYDVVFIFQGLKKGETGFTVQQRSPLGGNADIRYSASVSGDLAVVLEKLGKTDLDRLTQVDATLAMQCGEKTFYPTGAGDATDSFKEELESASPVKVLLASDKGKMTGELPFEIPVASEDIDANPGDIVADGSKISLFLEPGKTHGACLASLDFSDGVPVEFSGDELRASFYLEWSE